MLKRFQLILLFILGVSTVTYAQPINLIQPSMTPAQAVEDVLLGAGINAFNITYNGSAANANQVQQSVKRFTNSDPNFPLPAGVLMHTQGAPMVTTDPDLNAIAIGAADPYNGAIIEFDFVPSGDTLSFNYIFSSAEYSSYTCSGFNDVFGFFISGPGISGPYSNNSINIATVPNSNNIPVGINSVNGGSPTGFGVALNCAQVDPNWQANSIYFTTSYNSIYTTSGAPMNAYNGSTISLAANSNLSCQDTFHIKLAVANVGDNVLNSGVFLEANSFSSSGVDINIESNVSTGDTLLYEGCTEGTVYFARPPNQTGDSLDIEFEVGGTATEGDDFPELSPTNVLTFLPGEDTLSLTITPLDDGIPEGIESVTISAYSVTPCGDTVYSEGTIWIADEAEITMTATDTTILCANDSVPVWASANGGFPPYDYDWSNGETGSNTFAAALENGDTTYTITATDTCGFESSTTAKITLNQTLAIDSLTQQPADCGEENGLLNGYGYAPGYTGEPVYEWTGPGANNPDFSNSSVWGNKPSGWYYFTITDDVCSVTDSIFLEQEPPPNASFEADPEYGYSPLDVTFTNNSDPATTYYWDFGDGSSEVVGDLDDQHSTYYEEGFYTITLITEEGSCTDTATQVVEVALPLIYNVPNVFTPNGDGQNDFFTFNVENAKRLKIVILNRWGNVVFESTDANFAWNGKINNSGAECSDGTYFYKAEITDYAGEKVEEHGFVQLIND